MFSADNVVYLMWGIGVFLMKEAVLTAVAGAFRYEPPKGVAYVTSQAGCTVLPALSP